MKLGLFGRKFEIKIELGLERNLKWNWWVMESWRRLD
jgi:hypothetical protein